MEVRGLLCGGTDKGDVILYAFVVTNSPVVVCSCLCIVHTSCCTNSETGCMTSVLSD